MIGTLNNKNLKIDNFANLDEIIVKGLDNKNNYQIVNSLNLLKITRKHSLFNFLANFFNKIIPKNKLLFLRIICDPNLREFELFHCN